MGTARAVVASRAVTRPLPWSFAALLVALAFAGVACGGESASPAEGPGDDSFPAPDGSLLDTPPSDVAPEESAAPYPVVLAHGFFGFDDFANAGFFNYFYGVRDELTQRGYRVFTPTVDPFNDSGDRAAELLVQVQRILVETGSAKVNLIGHSQGGLDARAVASLRPDLVASVTTYGSPSTGLAIADALKGAAPWDPIRGVLDALVRVVAKPVYGGSVDEQTSLADALDQLSKDGLTEFSAAYPEAPGVAYFSIAGRTDWQAGGPECFPADRPAFLAAYDRELDSVDPFLAVAEAISDGGLFENLSNDGFVRVDEAKYGRFLGCVPADHLDQVGQLLGDSPGIGNDFDHIEFFSNLIDWLGAQGL